MKEEDTFWGSIPQPNHGKCRMILQNINGIKPQFEHSATHIMLEHAKEIDASILGLIETNVNWKFNDTRREFHNVLNKHWNRTSCAVSHSTYHFKSIRQPGGTATVVTSPWASRAKIGSDESGLGRWSTTTLHGRDQRHVTIITAYRVEGTIQSKGPYTAFQQQRYILESKKAACTDPKEAFLIDLGELVDRLIAQKHEIIIMMDANASSQKDKRFNQWIRDHNLIDPHTQLHGTENQPASYQGGSTRIDYFLTTGDIMDYVSAAGILPFHEYYESDHRAMFLDVDLAEYLKGLPSTQMSTDSRGITGKNPRAIQKYQAMIDKYLLQSDLEAKLTAFSQSSENGITMTSEQIAELQRLEAEFTKIRLAADTACKKLDNLPWSPELRNKYNAIRYWKLWLKEILTNRDYGVPRAKIIVGFPVPITCPSLPEIQTALRSATKLYRQARCNAIELRERFLTAQAEMYARHNSTKASLEVKRILYTELMARTYHHLRVVMGKTHSAPLSYLLIPSPDDTLTPILDASEIEHAIHQRNLGHFRQADETIFARGILPDTLGPYGTNAQAKEILNGKIPDSLSEITPAARDILQKCIKLPDTPIISNKISSKDYVGGYKRWNERTSTSPSGLHLGHDKAALRQLTTPSENERTFADKYFSVKALFMNIALQNTIVYERWTVVVNAMIEKIPGRPRLDKLRVIHLLESDLNMAMGILWGRRLLQQAETLGRLGEAQSGSRSDKRCQDVLLFKHSMYSVLRLTKSNGSTFDNDAKSCYDRIVMLLASLIGQSFGMCPKVCQLFIEVLRNTKYHAKTSYGISSLEYHTTEQYTIHGPGQGGRASPSIWTLISCTILQCMEDKFTGAVITCPQGKHTVQQVSSGFVDDITHWNINLPQSLTTSDDEVDRNDVLQHTQESAQYWTDLLYATGGLLEIPKCLYYAIIWKFNKEGIAYIDDHGKYKDAVQLNDPSTGTKFHIRAESGSIPHKTLGSLECPGGNYKAEHKRLLAKADDMAYRVSSTKLSAREAWCLFRSTYIPSITYSLIVGTLSERQAQTVQSKFIQAILPTMGYNSKTPQAIVFGPTSLGGLGLNHLFAEQGMMKTVSLIKNIRAGRPLGNLLMAQLCWAQMEAGISQSILGSPDIEIPPLQNELWIQTLREFLAKSQLRLCIPDIPIPSPRRINDKVLMDFASHFSHTEQQRINRCRIYLQVELLSEICDASGTMLSDDYYNCIRSERNSLDTRLWPRQHQPGPQHIKTWKQFLNQFLKRKKSYGISPSLGPWKDYSFFCHCQIYYETSLGWLCRTAPNGFTARYLTIDCRRRSWIGSRLTPCDKPDESWVKINIDVINDTIDTCEIAIPARVTDNMTVPSKHAPTWHQFLTTLPKLDQYLLQNIQFYDKKTPTCTVMADPTTILQIVSDGSVKEQTGTFGWIIATDTTVLFTNFGKCFGQPMTSHRAEFIGVLSWMIFIHRYSDFFSLSTYCTIAAHCDNLSVVNSTNKIHHRKLNEALDPDYDIACEVRHLFVELMQYFPTTIQHVKGHQDSNTPIAQLSWPAQLNVKADELADKGHECRNYITLEPIPTPRAKIFLVSGKSMICSGEKSMLRWRWREFILQDYFMKIFKITPSKLHNINWAAISMVRRKNVLPPKFLTKLLIKWLPTGTRLKKYGNSAVCCPLCNLDEDEHHILTCTKRNQQKNDFLKDLETELKNAATKPELADSILYGLRLFLFPATTGVLNWDQEIQLAFQLQSDLGWPLALRGLFVQQWSIQQEEFNPNTLGDSWQARITEFILLRMHQLWIERNTLIHDTAVNGNLKRVDEETIQQVQYLYECSTEISHHDRHELLSVPLQQRLTFSTAINSEWVKQTMSNMKRRMDNWKERRLKGQSDLRDFITTSRSTNIDTHRGTALLKKQHRPTREAPKNQSRLSSFFTRKTTTTQYDATLHEDTKPKTVWVHESQGNHP